MQLSKIAVATATSAALAVSTITARGRIPPKTSDWI